MSDNQEQLALGQREIEPGGDFKPESEAEQMLLDENNVSAGELQGFVDASGKQTINAAIGGFHAKIGKEVLAEKAAKAKAEAGAGEAKEQEQAT